MVKVYVCCLGYALTAVALYRLARYMCIQFPWIAIIPVVNIVYFCKISDRVFVEIGDMRYTYMYYVQYLFLAMSAFGLLLCQLDGKVMVLGRTLFICGILYESIVAFTCYATLIVFVLNWFWLLVPAPIALLVASIKINERMADYF